jgi:hypothetical protein
MAQVDAFTFTTMASLMPHYTIDDGNDNKLSKNFSTIELYIYLVKTYLVFLIISPGN